jgi:hypothetical protein
LVIPHLIFDGNEWKVSTKSGIEENYRKIKMEKISTKIWITHGLYVVSSPSTISDLIQKTYRCDATMIAYVGQVFTLDQFLFFSKNALICGMNRTLVKSEDGSKVPIEKIVVNLPKLLKFYCTCSPDTMDASSKTVQELIQIPHVFNIKSFEFRNLSEEFDVVSFYDYLKKNKHIKAVLVFRGLLSEAYEKQLEAIVDDILARKPHIYAPPIIAYHGQNQVKLRTLLDIRKSISNNTVS